MKTIFWVASLFLVPRNLLQDDMLSIFLRLRGALLARTFRLQMACFATLETLCAFVSAVILCVIREATAEAPLLVSGGLTWFSVSCVTFSSLWETTAWLSVVTRHFIHTTTVTTSTGFSPMGIFNIFYIFTCCFLCDCFAHSFLEGKVPWREFLLDMFWA